MRPFTGAWISSPFTSTLAIPTASLDRHLNQLYRVPHAQRVTHLLAHGGDLDRAAGVAGGDHLRARGEQVLDLAPPELAGGLGVQQVVDTRGAATNLPARGLHQVELRDLG